MDVRNLGPVERGRGFDRCDPAQEYAGRETQKGRRSPKDEKS